MATNISFCFLPVCRLTRGFSGDTLAPILIPTFERSRFLIVASRGETMDHKTSAVTDARTPKYRRIRDYLYSEIRSGRLSPGQSLPTEARLAESLGMSRNTIRQALSELQEEGMVDRVQGRGTFVTTEQQRQSRQQLDFFALIAPQIREGFYPSLVAGLEQARRQSITR